MNVVYVEDLNGSDPLVYAKQCAQVVCQNVEVQQRSNGAVLTKDEFEQQYLAPAFATLATANFNNGPLAAREASGLRAITAPGFLPYAGAPESERNIAWAPSGSGGYAAYIAKDESGANTFGSNAGAEAYNIAVMYAAYYKPEGVVSPIVPGSSTAAGLDPQPAKYESYVAVAEAIQAGAWTPAPATDICAWSAGTELPISSVTVPPATL